MDRYTMEMSGMDDAWVRMGYSKMVEEREMAARYSLVLEARRAKCENRQTSGSALSRMWRMLAGTFGNARPGVESAVPARHAR